MNTARLALGLLWLCAGCEAHAAFDGAASQCTCVAPAAHAESGTESGAEAASEPIDSASEALVEPSVEASVEADTSEAAADAVAFETGSDASSPADASVEVGPPVYPAWCSDQLKDGDETDVDCGGHCPPCGPRMACLVDADCSKTAAGCDATSGGCFCDAVASICVHSHCFDHVKDGDESDGDCGGATCILCAVGQGCASDADCAAAACDLGRLTCVEYQCADHHKDGNESDVDCGGGCTSCAVGAHCAGNGDCMPGHICNGSKVCQ